MANDGPAGPADSGGAESDSASLLGRVGSLREELLLQVRSMGRLWMLESQLAVQSAIRMLALAAAAILLAVTAWIFVVLAIAVRIVRTQAHPEIALLALAAITGVVAWLTWRNVGPTLDRDWFPATRRRLDAPGDGSNPP